MTNRKVVKKKVTGNHIIRKQENNTSFFGDLIRGVGSMISNSDISLKVDNFEIKKDKKNNVQFSMFNPDQKRDEVDEKPEEVTHTGDVSSQTNT